MALDVSAYGELASMLGACGEVDHTVLRAEDGVKLLLRLWWSGIRETEGGTKDKVYPQGMPRVICFPQLGPTS